MSKAMEVNVSASDLREGDKIVQGAEYFGVEEVTSTRNGILVKSEGASLTFDYNESVRIRKRS